MSSSRNASGHVRPGAFCTIGDSGSTEAGTPMECKATGDGKRARWRMAAGATPASRARKRPRRSPAEKNADKLRRSEIGALRRAGGMPWAEPLPRRASQYDKLKDWGFLDDKRRLTDAGRDALRRRGAYYGPGPSPAEDRSADAGTDWSAFSVCPTCGADAGAACHDLRNPDSLNATPHPGRPQRAADTLDEIKQRVANKQAAAAYRLEHAPIAHDLINHPDRFAGKTITFTATGQGGQPGKTFTGELERAKAITPVGNDTFTGVQLKGHGIIWADPNSPVTVEDRSADAGTDWSRYRTCPTCFAQAGRPCHDLGKPGSYNATPHPGRPLTEAAADRQFAEKLDQAAANGDFTSHEPGNACELGLWHTGPCPPKGRPATDHDTIRAADLGATDGAGPVRPWCTPEEAADAFALASNMQPKDVPDDVLDKALLHQSNSYRRDMLLDEAVRRTTPVNPNADVVNGRYSSTPERENTWGAGKGDISYHPDGITGRGLQQMGSDRFMDVDGEPIANVAGRIATRVVRCQITPQQGFEEMRALRDRTPETSAARRGMDMIVAGMGCPQTPPPRLPDATPEPIRRLARDLHEQFPLIRRDGRETGKLVDIANAWVGGDRNTVGLRLPDRIRYEVAGAHHESDGDRGRIAIDERVYQAARELEALLRQDRKALYPPQQERTTG